MHVLVTTEHRGVFFGEIEGEPSKEQVTLKNARNCVYWTASLKGVFGLAVDGPGEGCKIGPATKTKTLYGITSVDECTPEAVAAWERAPWV